MRIDPQARLTIEKIHLFSGQKKETVKEFFETFFVLVILDFLEGKNTDIPFFGKITIKYLGDKIKKKGKQAKIELEFKANDVLLRNIGQIIDKEDCDLFKLLETKIQNSLKKYKQ